MYIPSSISEHSACLKYTSNSRCSLRHRVMETIYIYTLYCINKKIVFSTTKNRQTNFYHLQASLTEALLTTHREVPPLKNWSYSKDSKNRVNLSQNFFFLLGAKTISQHIISFHSVAIATDQHHCTSLLPTVTHWMKKNSKK